MFRGEGMSDTDQMLADMIATVQRMQAQIAVLEGAPSSDEEDPMPAPPAYPAPAGGGAQGPPAYPGPEPAPSPPVVPAASVLGEVGRVSLGEAPQPFLVGGAAAMRPACKFAAKYAAGQRAQADVAHEGRHVHSGHAHYQGPRRELHRPEVAPGRRQHTGDGFGRRDGALVGRVGGVRARRRRDVPLGPRRAARSHGHPRRARDQDGAWRARLARV